MTRTHTCLLDSPQHYGAITRWLHWSMGALFAWQFAGAALHAWDREAAATRWFWSSHGSLGVVLLMLVVLRGIWGLLNVRRRPPAVPNLWGRLSKAGHLTLYALMAFVPFVAMLRTYGGGKGFGFGFALFWIKLFEATGRENASLIAVGNALHGEAGWVMLAIIAGHVAMVGVHKYVWRDQVATRMLPSRRGA